MKVIRTTEPEVSKLSRALANEPTRGEPGLPPDLARQLDACRNTIASMEARQRRVEREMRTLRRTGGSIPWISKASALLPWIMGRL